MAVTYFHQNVNPQSFLPFILFILGIAANYFIAAKFYSWGVMMMLIGFLLYVINNVLTSVVGTVSVFNEYLENISSFVTFGLTPVIFAFVLFENNFLMFIIVSFYSFCILLALARNWICKFKNTRGFPLALNGVFFPLTYYFFEYYLGSSSPSFFFLFYLIVGVLSISEHNYLIYDRRAQKQYENYDEKHVEESPEPQEVDFIEENLPKRRFREL